MARTAKQPPSEARRSKATDLPAPNGHDDRAKQGLRRERELARERDEQDLGREQGLAGERDEQNLRREQGLAGEHDEQDLRREQGLAGEHDEQDWQREQGEQWLYSERGEEGSRREPHRQPGGVQRTTVGSVGNQLQQPTGWLKPATSTDALAPVFAAWEQFLTSWFELAETMMKVQQQTFASMIGAGAATTKAERITNDDHPSRDHDALSASRTSSVAPDQIGHDRR
jgi:hypothetical protein